MAALHIEDSLEFTVQFLVNTLNSKNAYEGAMLFEVLRNLCNLSEMKIHQEFLVKFGIISHLSRILRGKLIERLFWKTTESNDEYSSYEKYLATKCLYSYAIDSKHSKIIIADELLLEGRKDLRIAVLLYLINFLNNLDIYKE